ncbi:hypothetical protein GF325_17235 [Candidatus Bathyarchaeota archaeon]|nr:hypothetical protein [Candidatus Bathyarchaeota archaeon]
MGGSYRAFVLSQFSSIEGPQVFFLVSSGFIDETLKEEISNVLNLNVSKDYFIFRIGDLTTYNIQFDIRSSHARGNCELLMLSYITNRFPLKKEQKYFLKKAKEYITFLKSEENLAYIFHLNEIIDMTEQEFTIIENLYGECLERLRHMLEDHA